ncbi:hypothetical protein MKX01_028818 [Papaver californicum]|nr:hypothetical protein MKX01_028818 [Papaver californicum]
MEDQRMLSMVSNITTLNGVVVGEEDCSDSNSTSNISPRRSSNNHQGRQDISVTSSARFKGVVLLPNGSWGAQIYANRKHTWIGTFKSESEAGKGYAAASAKLRREDSRRECPLTSTLTSLEPDFQKLLTIDEILSMLRDGSYQTVLDKEPGLSPSLGSAAMDGDVTYQQLFQKELTPSHVGKLNRLVIHKRFAEKYFPEVSKEEKDAGVIDDIQLSFFDREIKGWNRFVKDKKLKATDVVTFYKCECQKEQKAFYMIDVASIGAESNGGFAGGFDTDAGDRVDLQLGTGQITINESGPSDRIAPPQPEEEEKTAAVRLFGVNIS